MLKKKNSGFNAFNFQQLSNSLLDELKRQDHDGFSFNKLIPSSRYIEINNQNIHAPLRPVDSDAVGSGQVLYFLIQQELELITYKRSMI